MSENGAHSARAALTRSLAALTIGEPKAYIERESELYDLRAMDMAQHVIAPFSGNVLRQPLWTTLRIAFPNPFIMAMDPGKTDSTVRHPHFTSGVECRAPIIVHANLTGWASDDRDFFTGASLNVGVYAPNAPKRVSFEGQLHLTFFGYAAPEEDDSQG